MLMNSRSCLALLQPLSKVTAPQLPATLRLRPAGNKRVYKCLDTFITPVFRKHQPAHRMVRITAAGTATDPAAVRAEPVRWGASKDGISVTSKMDGGNIEVVDISKPSAMQLRIIPDPWCETDRRSHFMYFSYRVAGVQETPLSMCLTNAGQASYPFAWPGYQACASYDLEDWFRVPTVWDATAGTLTINHTPEQDAVHYAYFAPYSMDRHAQLIHRMQMREGVRLKVLGYSLDGQPMDMLQVGEPGPGKRNIWVIARQHPGETMAEYYVEGLLERLTDLHDPVTASLRNTCCFFIIPNMCPDGSARGHLRTNAAGINLNRAWAEPDPNVAPEVYHTLAEMDARGVDMLLDVHGDEELPYNFVAGLDGIPAWDERLKALQDNFKAAYCRHSPDFQVEYGYPRDAPNSANLALCSKQIGQRFKALSLTLEMPFKDCKNLPNTRTGWSPQRAQRLGAAGLGAILEVVPQLR